MSETIIDDQDPQVHYDPNGKWIRGGSPSEHDETVSSSTVAGAFFTVDFFGNKITVYGTIDGTSQGVLTNYSVDGVPAEQMTSQAGQGDTHNQQFWSSPELDVGQHHLQVTMVQIHANQTPGEGTIWFDYFRVIDPTIRPPSSTHKKNIGAIVGGVMGGIVLSLLILHFFVLRKRRKQSVEKPFPFPWRRNDSDAESSSPNSQTPDKGNFTPFPLVPVDLRGSLSSPTSDGGSTTSPASARSRKMMALNHAPVSVPSTAGPPSSTSTSITTVTPSSPSEETRRLSTIHETIQSAVVKHNPGVINIIIPQPTPSATASSGESSQPVQHVDSGVRALNIQEDVSTSGIELPPIYSPV